MDTALCAPIKYIYILNNKAGLQWNCERPSVVLVGVIMNRLSKEKCKAYTKNKATGLQKYWL